MLTLREIYGERSLGAPPAISVEIFPPKTPDGDTALMETLDRLAAYRPAFVSCTYGAGGSTRDRTLELCREIESRYDTVATAHLTCVGSTRDELIGWIARVRSSGIGNIMALRGDPPRGENAFAAVPGGLEHANELVELIREESDELGVGVAAYPEVHPEAPDAATDLDNLKRKIDAGASRAMTQFFFDVDLFLRFRDRAQAAGIDVTIVPGILPVTNYARLVDFSARCGATLPDWLARLFDGLDDDPDTRRLISGWIAIEQCRRLIDHGVQNFHFYTLNRAEVTRAICHSLGIRASLPLAGAVA